MNGYAQPISYNPSADVANMGVGDRFDYSNGSYLVRGTDNYQFRENDDTKGTYSVGYYTVGSDQKITSLVYQVVDQNTGTVIADVAVRQVDIALNQGIIRDYANNKTTVFSSDGLTGENEAKVYSGIGDSAVLESTTKIINHVDGGISIEKKNALDNIIYQEVDLTDGSWNSTSYYSDGTVSKMVSVDADGSSFTTSYNQSGVLMESIKVTVQARKGTVLFN